MSPRDTLAADLAALLPGCAVAADGPARIRIDIPKIGQVFLAVSKTGHRVETCDSQGKAPTDRRSYDYRAVTPDEARLLVWRALNYGRWQHRSATLGEVEVLAAAGFADKTRELAESALRRLDRERAEVAEQIRTKQALDAKLSAEQDSYRALLETL